MPTKVFVGRITEGTPSDDIKALFKKFGTVTECDVIANYGFVHMDNEEEAKSAIAALDGYSVNGSHIHVELSTTNTQGRKKRGGDHFRGNGRGGGSDRGGGGHYDRYEPYPPPRRDNYMGGGGPDMERGRGGMPPERGMDRGAAPPREEYASEQVKDLLELYFRDPHAFDQYARSYYYGERSERSTSAASGPPPVAPGPPAGRGYYDNRPSDMGYPPARRDEDLRAGGGYKSGGYGPPPAGYDAPRIMRDDRGGSSYYK